MTTTPTPEAVDRFNVVDLHPSVGTGSFMELDELGDWVRFSDYKALADRVDALTRDLIAETERANAQYDRAEAALARLGAVQRETLERAATIVRRAGHSLADEIELLPIDPDAAAALERALEAERLKCAGIPYDPKYSDDWLGMTCAILARGQKGETP